MAGPPEWLAVPPIASQDWRTWAIETVRDSLISANQVEFELSSDNAGKTARQSIDSLCEFAAMAVPAQRVFAALAVAERPPVPVLVAVGAHDSANPVDLLLLCGATGGNPLDPPTVEYPDLGGSGDAVLVTRIDREADGVVWASVAMARRTESTDTVLIWRTTDLDLLVFMPDRLENLLLSIHIQEGAA